MNSRQSAAEVFSASPMFKHRVCVVATMHRKEQVIAPILERELGLVVQVPQGLNTDEFGTFSREIKRVGTQLEAARQKAEQAMAMTGQSLALASEGSFGPHPALPYLPYNREIVVLIDRHHDLEIVGRAASIETNYSHRSVRSFDEAFAFARQAGFPNHGLVVIAGTVTDAAPIDRSQIIKGITTEVQLQDALTWAFSQSQQVHLETDMRALYNPTRMKAIEQATLNLIEKIAQVCPDCGCPGFDVVKQQPGLPCGLCHLPTSLIRSVIHQCQKCGFKQERLFPNGVSQADPSQCAYCNP